MSREVATVAEEDRVELTEKQRQRRRSRSIALALALGALVLLFYLITLFKGIPILERPL